jgi:hypothetical protein
MKFAAFTEAAPGMLCTTAVGLPGRCFGKFSASSRA